MGNSRTKLALFAAAALSARGVQIPQDSHLLLQQNEVDTSPIEQSGPSSVVNSSADLRAFQVKAQTSRLLPAMLHYLATLPHNQSQFIQQLGNETGLQLSEAESRILTMIDAETTALFEEWHALSHKSEDSADRMAKLANFTSSNLMQQVALQSASIVAELQALEQESARNAGKAGPAHLFPQAHVVSRDPNRAARNQGGEQAAEVAVQEEDNPLEAPSLDSVGTARLAFALTGVVIVILSAIITANRKNPIDLTRQKKAFYMRAPLTESTASRTRVQKEQPVLQEESAKPMSVWDGTVATFSCIVGTGLLAMPYAFSLAGLAAMPILIFFVCCSAYTAHLMVWSLNSANEAVAEGSVKPSSRGWGFLVEVAFGRRAKSAINAFLIVELWGYLLSSTVCCAMNLTQITQEFSSSFAVGLSVSVCYCLTFVPTAVLTKVNVLSNAVFMACCVMFLITGLLLPERAPSSDIQWINPKGLASAVGILVFSPAGHGFYPSLMQRMEEPKQFTTCVKRAYSAAVVIYFFVAVLGYYLFGRAARPSAVQNIGADIHLIPIPHLGWMNTLAAVGMVLKMLAMQGLVLPPLSSTVEGVLLGRGGENKGLQILVAPVLLLVTASLAIRFASQTAMLMNLLGSVFCMNIAFVVPVLCYWKLAPGPLGFLRQLIFLSLIMLGGTCAILGVVVSL